MKTEKSTRLLSVVQKVVTSHSYFNLFKKWKKRDCKKLLLCWVKILFLLMFILK